MASLYRPADPSRRNAYLNPPAMGFAPRPSRRGGFPSVLDATPTDTPQMTYAQAIEYIKRCVETSTCDVTQHCPIDLHLFDPAGGRLEQSMDAFSIKVSTSLREIIMKIQVELDVVAARVGYGRANSKEKLLVRGVEIVIGKMMDGMPIICGELVGEKENETVAEWVRWRVGGGQVEEYWGAYRMLLLQIPCSVNSEKPYMKVRTIRREGKVGDSLVGGGHMFDTGASTQYDEKPQLPQLDADEDLIDAVRQKIDEGPNLLGIAIPEITLTTLILKSIKIEDAETNPFSDVTNLHRDMLRAGKMPIKAIAYKPREDGATATESKNWSYYQKKGGHPQVHELIPLGHIPFSEDFVPTFVDADDPDFPSIARYAGKGKERAVGYEEASKERIVMVPYNDFIREAEGTAEQEATGKREGPGIFSDEGEAAIGLDAKDDDIFFSKPPMARKSPGKHDAPATTRAAKRPKPAEEISAFNFEKYGGNSSSNAFGSPYLNSLATSSRPYPPGLYTPATHAANKLAATSPYQSPATTTVSSAMTSYLPPTNSTINPAAAPYQSPAMNTGNPAAPSYQSSANTTLNPLMAAYQPAGVNPAVTSYQASANPYARRTAPRYQSPEILTINPTAAPYNAMIQAPSTPDPQYGTSMRLTNVSPYPRNSAAAPLRADSPAFKFPGTGGAGTSHSYHAPNVGIGPSSTHPGGAGTSNSYPSRFFPPRQPAQRPRPNLHVDLSFNNAPSDPGSMYSFGTSNM